MNELVVSKFAALSLVEIIIVMAFILFCAIVLLFSLAAAFDRLNIKSFSFRNGLTFYQEGEERKRKPRRVKKARTTK